MRYNGNELILNNISAGEFLPPFNKGYQDYAKIAHLFLNHKGKHLFKEEILSNYSEGVTLEQLFEQESHRFVQGFNHERNGKMEKTWYDLWSMEEIKRNDDFFDFFFTCRLRHLSLLDIDEFLSFHLDYSFNNNKQDFFRFLNLTLRQYKEQLLNSNIIETVGEWIKTHEKEIDEGSSLGSDKHRRIKGRIQREANDKLTALSLEQTALLIQFMQEARIILKGDYLNYVQAGRAFSDLTGYSPDTLRQKLGIKGEIGAAKYEDYKELYQVILEMAKKIEVKIPKK